jgi:hypothetical protein
MKSAILVDRDDTPARLDLVRACAPARALVYRSDLKLRLGRPEKFEDRYETALIDLINPKRAGKPITPKERPAAGNVVDLMEALRRSVGGATAETKSPKKSATKPRKAAAGQKEMLMPIEGKKSKEAAAKKPVAKAAAQVGLMSGPEANYRRSTYRRSRYQSRASSRFRPFPRPPHISPMPLAASSPWSSDYRSRSRVRRRRRAV